MGFSALVERIANRTWKNGPYKASEKAEELHGRLTVVDLHADSLMLGRNLNERSKRGHVDIPRLIDGNVALQAFTVVTKTPLSSNINRTSDSADMMTLLARLSGWPEPAVRSMKERALLQAARMRETDRRSGDEFTFIRTAADLEKYIESRGNGKKMTAGYLGLEGAHALEGDIDNLALFFDEGFRMISPTHFFDNDIGGAQQGMKKEGLTELGREMISRMQDKGMAVDLAHSSAAVISDVLEMAKKPVLVSHTGVKGVCDNNRNISDEQIKGIADNGGVIGIGYWEKMTGGRDAAAIARAIKHTVNAGGIECVALGSDFDGFIRPPFDTSGLPLITEALLDAGFEESDILKIMGENAVRVLLEVLPS